MASITEVAEKFFTVSIHSRQICQKSRQFTETFWLESLRGKSPQTAGRCGGVGGPTVYSDPGSSECMMLNPRVCGNAGLPSRRTRFPEAGGGPQAATQRRPFAAVKRFSAFM